MIEGTSFDGPLGPAERRVLELLVLIDEQQPRTDRALTDRVVDTARWQYAVRGVLHVTGLIGAAVIDGVGLVIGAATPDRDAR